MNILAPSILAADFCSLGEQIKTVEQNGAKYLHIDVMDGSFVPCISFGMPLISSLRKNSNMVFDVHLMIDEPIRYIKDFKECGADIITVHAEACTHLNRTVSAIKEMGMKSGIALNPATSLEVLRYAAADADMILLMSVNPGFGGQKLIPFTYNKIRDLSLMLKKNDISCDIEVDGGINLVNVKDVLDAGANVIVSGSSVFNGNIENNVKAFMEVLHAAE